MTTIHSGHTLFSTGTLDAPHVLIVDGGAGLHAGNGATNNYVISLDGGLTQGGAGAAGLVLAKADATNGAAGSIAIRGGGSFDSAAGDGATLTVDGVLTNLGNIYVAQDDYIGGAARLDVALGGSLDNSGTIQLTTSPGSQYLPFAFVNGPSVTVEGILTNSGSIAISGGHLGDAYGGAGGLLLLDGLGIDSQIVNTGSITINGAYVSADGLGGLAPQTAGVLNVTGGTLVNQGMITINAAQYNESGHGAAGGLLEINTEAGVMLNSGLITVDAQYGGVGGPAGTLAIGGYVASTGIINVESSAYAGGAGGVLYVAPGTSSHFDIQGSVNLVGYGVNTGGGGTAVFAGTVDIAPVAGAAAAAGVSVGNGAGPILPGAGSLTISGYTLLASTNSYIDLLGVQGGLLGGVPGSLTITDTGTLGVAGGFIFGNGFLTNQGYLDSVGGGKITVDEFRNDGLVTSDFGNLAIMAGTNAGNYGGSAIQGTGQFSITAGGTLSFYVGVGSGQTVTFAAAPGAPDTLALQTSGDFGGVLSGLNDSSVIDLLGQDVTGVTTSGDLLTVIEPGVTYHFSLAAPLPAGTGFSLNPDGNGGTDIGILTPGGVIAEHGPGHAGGADPLSSFTGHLTA